MDNYASHSGDGASSRRGLRDPLAMWKLFRFSGLLLMSTLAVNRTVGQVSDTLVWEPVGDVQQVTWLAFDVDTLYAGTESYSDQRGDLYIAELRPSSSEWARAFDHTLRGDGLVFFPGGLTFFRASRRLGHSLDGGHTFSDGPVIDGVFSLPVRVPDGGLVVGYDSATRPAARSDDDGLTWTVHDGPDLALTPTHLEVLPAAAGLPDGRVVGAGYGGIGYSDDGGRTWAPTEFSGSEGVAFAAWTLARVAEGPRDGGHGGALLAVVEGNGGLPPTVHRSVDDGLTWKPVAPTPMGIGYTARLLAGPDGAVYLYSVSDTEDHDALPIWRSTDGGATWDDVGPLWTAWRAYPTELAVGPDGHLWASAMGEYRYGLRVGGVFRTTTPVYAVAGEAWPARHRRGPGLSVFPNPAGRVATVALALASPAEVSVRVYDLMGREVAVVHEGPAPDGARLWVETAGWPAGTYVVRAEASGVVASVVLVVAR